MRLLVINIIQFIIIIFFLNKITQKVLEFVNLGFTGVFIFEAIFKISVFSFSTYIKLFIKFYYF